MKFQRPKVLTYQEAIRFHGHNGPFLALGYRLGEHLSKRLRSKGIMDLKITVKCKTAKPFTCLIDGLQCSTFATFGKGNMKMQRCMRGDITVLVEKRRGRYIYKITKNAMNICLTATDLERAARKILRTPAKDLWKVR